MKKQTKLLLSLLFVFAVSISFHVFADGDDSEEVIIYEAQEFEDGEHYETASADGIKVILNGNELDFTDDEGNKVEPQIINDRTMVPMRKIFEALGAEIRWNPVDRAVLATKEGLEIGLQIDNMNATVTNNGETNEIVLDAAPVIVDGRTLVPVRFIAESLNKNVIWDEEDRNVIITDTEEDAEYFVFTPEEDLSETIYYDYWIDANMEGE